MIIIIVIIIIIIIIITMINCIIIIIIIIIMIMIIIIIILRPSSKIIITFKASTSLACSTSSFQVSNKHEIWFPKQIPQIPHPVAVIVHLFSAYNVQLQRRTGLIQEVYFLPLELRAFAGSPSHVVKTSGVQVQLCHSLVSF